MSLVAVDEVRALVPTALTDDDLQAAIDREEKELVRRFGPHYVDENTTVTETHYGDGSLLWLNRRPLSIATITEYGSLSSGATPSVLASSAYYLDIGMGALARVSGGWGSRVVVEYVPEDDNALRKSVLIDLVRLAIQTKPYQSESMGGDGQSYSYNAGQGGATGARENIYRRLVGIRA